MVSYRDIVVEVLSVVLIILLMWMAVDYVSHPNAARLEARAERQAEAIRQAEADRQAEAKRQALYASWSAEDIRKINEGLIWIGMTAEQTLASWGWPTGTRKTVTASVVYEDWVYNYSGGRPYAILHFENDILVSWDE